jgi:hypothetical protein
MLILDDKGSKDCASNQGADSLKYPKYSPKSRNMVTLAQEKWRRKG